MVRSKVRGGRTSGTVIGVTTLIILLLAGAADAQANYTEVIETALPEAGSISGFKVNDTNSNGVWDSGETGIGGWNIMLLDDKDIQIDSTSTDDSGFYEFMNLTPGNYNVAEEMRVGFTPTTAVFRVVTVENTDITDVNFLNKVEVTPPPTGSISGMKFNDSNGNGVRDEGDEGLSGWTITLTNPDGSMESTTTNADGFYMFSNLSAGNYSIEEVLQPGWVRTFPSVSVRNITLLAEENVTDIDFGNMQSPTPTPTKTPTPTPTPAVPPTTVPPTTVPPTTVPPTTVPVPTPTHISIPYTISVSTSPSGLNPQPAGEGIYDNGTTATVAAQTVTGYTFQGWTENGIQVSNNASYQFPVTGNRSLVAKYSQNQYNISASVLPSGLDPKPTGGGTYYYEDTATVTIQPVTGYIFQGWTENGIQVSTNTSYSFTVTENRTLMAEHVSVPTPGPTSIPFTVSVSTSPSDLNPQPTGGGAYSRGDTIMVTAQPVAGYKFQKWVENGKTVSTNASYRSTVTDDKDLRAEYSEGEEPSIILEPGSGTPGSEITVEGTGFKISAEESQKVLIYLDDRIVKEGAIERDTSGSPGSFRTTFIVPSNITSGHYGVVAKGLTDSAGADFEVASVSDGPGVEPIEPILVYIAEISSIIAAVALLKYLLKKPPTPQTQQIKKQLPIKIETTGGIESTYYREHAIDVEVRGGAERL